MSENQNVEYKLTWRDEYLRWVCGFANADGGVIYIGVNDAGKVVGVKNIDKLMVDIPNKIQSGLGLVVSVNRLSEDGLDYVEIKIDPVDYPVNYRGEYHFRSGNTKQQLCGFALTEFIKKKTGHLWESEPVSYIGVDDLDRTSIEIFKREAIRKKRMDKADLKIPDRELLEHLGLMAGDKLTRAAVLLFYRYPGRYIPGHHVKIGKFGEGPDLLYHDDLEGSLFSIADQVDDLIFTKYLKAKITYDRDVRVETFPFPWEGVREAVFNAIIHNNYARYIPIHIRIEEDQMFISNGCILPLNWTAENIIHSNESRPLNPLIANAFYRAGYIESWGRGIQLIKDSCRKLGTPEPEYTVIGDALRIKFTALENAKITEHTQPKQQNESIKLSKDEKLLLEAIKNNPEATQEEYAKLCNFSLFRVKQIIKQLQKNKLIIRNGSKKKGTWEICKNDF